MLKNYFKTAFRNIWRHKGFSIINIMGLAVGMSACFLIFLYVHFELSYDSFNTKADRIYRLVTDVQTPTEKVHFNSSGAMALNVKNDFPEVESFVRVNGASLLVRKGIIKFQEEHSVFADSSFFEVFTLPLKYGNPHTALKQPFNIVFSETAAKKYFGNTNPVGQTMLLTDGNYAATVTGVMKDMPENAHFKADMIVSMYSFRQFDSAMDQEWGNFGINSYLLLKPGTNATALEAKLPAFIEKHDGREMKESQTHFTLLLEPLKDVYLKSNRRGAESGNMSNVYIFSMVGVFILLIACFNFINLTTARSSERAKEVGIRKVVGAEKFQLTKQFLSESILICLMAFVLAVLLCALALPLFNQLSGKVVSDGIFSNPGYILILFALSVCIGIIAGIYPALVLSSFMPITVLKGRFATGTKGLLLRKGLVISQFTISIALIIGTIVVYSQLTYMRNQDLGFNKSQMMVLDTHGDNHNKALNNEIASIRGVISTTMSSSIPGGGAMNALSQLENKHGDMQTTGVDLYFVDYNYIPQYQIKLVAGRTFSKDFGSDTTQAMILNETAVKMLGYTSAQQAVGRRFSQWGRQGKIIGVIKDFHYQSLQENIKPLSMRVEPDGVDQISINIATQNMSATVAAIQKKWERIIPYRPFNYYFVDESFDKLYRAEDRFGNLFLNFAILAIFISSLGLLGLASYSTIQRTKEIGVRKVMGASVGNITVLLSKEFVQLVFISIIIATPIAWWVMANWLHDFAYRISVSWWMFVAAGLLALFVALATISYQAIKAALMNPVKSLRTE